MQKLFRGVNVTSRAVSISKEMRKVIRAGVGDGDWMVESRSETENSRNTVRKYFLGGVIEFPPLFPYEWSPPREKRVAESSRKTARESRAVRNVKTEFKGGYLMYRGWKSYRIWDQKLSAVVAFALLSFLIYLYRKFLS